jgi:hypothetical protein
MYTSELVQIAAVASGGSGLLEDIDVNRESAGGAQCHDVISERNQRGPDLAT